MTKSLLFVESKPVSADLAEEYHRWHDQVHLPEMLTIDGFVSARRWQTDGESFITLYEIDTDVDAARTNLRAAFASGRCGVRSTPRTTRYAPKPQRGFNWPGTAACSTHLTVTGSGKAWWITNARHWSSGR